VLKAISTRRSSAATVLPNGHDILPRPFRRSEQDETVELRPKPSTATVSSPPSAAMDTDTWRGPDELAWMNAEAICEQYHRDPPRWSIAPRFRQLSWRKGDTSGHEQHVDEILVDCDQDAVLLKVRQTGAALPYGPPRLLLSHR